MELIRYPSARDPLGGINVAAFGPAVLGSAKPRGFETWHCTATTERIELAKADYFKREAYAFRRQDFLVRGSLPVPAI